MSPCKGVSRSLCRWMMKGVLFSMTLAFREFFIERTFGFINVSSICTALFPHGQEEAFEAADCIFDFIRCPDRSEGAPFNETDPVTDFLCDMQAVRHEKDGDPLRPSSLM